MKLDRKTETALNYGSEQQNVSASDETLSREDENVGVPGDGSGELWEVLSGKVSFCIFPALVILTDTTISFATPFYPPEGVQRGISETIVGVILSSCPFTQCITALLFGRLESTFGSKALVIGGCVLSGVFTALTGALEVVYDPVAFTVCSLLFRSLVGIGIGGSTTAVIANISVYFPKHVATISGIVESCTGLGFILGPVIGAFLYQTGGFKVPFLVVGILLCFGGLCVIFVNTEPPETSGEDPSKSSGKELTYSRALRIPAVPLLNYVIFQEMLKGGFYDVGLSLHVQQFNLQPAAVGGIFLACGGCYTIVSPAAGAFVDRKKIYRPVIVSGLLFGTLSMLLLGSSPMLHLPSNVWFPVAGSMLVGVALGLCVVPSYSNMLRMASSRGYSDNLTTYGIITALLMFSNFLGQFLGPLVGGALIDAVGFSWAATIFAGMTLATGVTVFIFSVWELNVFKCLRNLWQDNPKEEEQQYILRRPEEEPTNNKH